jgi:hypothetical protein
MFKPHCLVFYDSQKIKKLKVHVNIPNIQNNNKTKRLKMWTMWQGWKDEEQRRIRAEQENARLLGTLRNVANQRDDALKERDDALKERDELAEEVKKLKEQLNH